MSVCFISLLAQVASAISARSRAIGLRQGFPSRIKTIVGQSEKPSTASLPTLCARSTH